MYLAFLKRDRSQGKLPITGRPNRERLITSLALCRLFPEPGVPEYSLIMSLHHIEPTQNCGIQVICSDSRNPSSRYLNKRLHGDEPIDITQVRHSLKVADPPLKRGEGKQLHELRYKVRPHSFQNFHIRTSLPLDKFTGRNRQGNNVDSDKHIADHNGYTFPGR